VNGGGYGLLEGRGLLPSTCSASVRASRTEPPKHAGAHLLYAFAFSAGSAAILTGRDIARHARPHDPPA
jgi:hypothetical protein